MKASQLTLQFPEIKSPRPRRPANTQSTKQLTPSVSPMKGPAGHNPLPPKATTNQLRQRVQELPDTAHYRFGSSHREHSHAENRHQNLTSISHLPESIPGGCTQWADLTSDIPEAPPLANASHIKTFKLAMETKRRAAMTTAGRALNDVHTLRQTTRNLIPHRLRPLYVTVAKCWSAALHYGQQGAAEFLDVCPDTEICLSGGLFAFVLLLSSDIGAFPLVNPLNLLYRHVLILSQRIRHSYRPWRMLCFTNYVEWKTVLKSILTMKWLHHP
jgi:hypothetical protein